jgi:hypothetical protein
MKKIALSLLAVSALISASEFQYGSGTFSMEGGFLGLTQSIDTDVTTYSLVERHSNLFSSDFFYGYDVTWYDSQALKQLQHSYNDVAGAVNSQLSSSVVQVPSLEHRLTGLDANIRVGYDVLHTDNSNFLGFGVLLGVSLPWIDSSSSSSDSDTDYLEDSKTEFTTYKVGPTINFQKTLISDKLSVYGVGSFAFQTASIKNSYAQSDFTVNGTFQEYNIGLHYTPFTKNYDLGWFTLSPRVYATVGYKYTKWDLDEMVVDVSGRELSSNILSPLKTKFGMDSSIGYVGVGYSF